MTFSIIGPGTPEPRDPLPAPEVQDMRTALQGAFAAERESLRDVAQLSLDALARREQQFVEAVGTAGLPPTTAERIYRELTRGDLAVARGAAVDPSAMAAQTVEARRLVRETFESRGWKVDDLFTRTAAFVKAHPALEQVLAQHGVGTHPDVLLAIVDHVRRQPVGPKPWTG